MKLVRNILLPFCLALAVLSAPVFANRNEAIAVNADYAERNEITGLTEYRGNVIIRPVSYTHLTLPTSDLV